MNSVLMRSRSRKPTFADVVGVSPLADEVPLDVRSPGEPPAARGVEPQSIAQTQRDFGTALEYNFFKRKEMINDPP